MNDTPTPANPTPGLQPLDELKRVLRINAPITHSPSHGTVQFGTGVPRAKQPSYDLPELIAVAALDINAGEWNY